MVTIPRAIVTTDPSIRYATALLIDMSSGPMWIGTHVAQLELVRRVELLLRGSLRGEGERVQQQELHRVASCPKYASSETASSRVYASA